MTFLHIMNYRSAKIGRYQRNFIPHLKPRVAPLDFVLDLLPSCPERSVHPMSDVDVKAAGAGVFLRKPAALPGRILRSGRSRRPRARQR